MKPEQISPDDPRLTAYALNEMEPAEREAFEQMLAKDPVAQAQVREIAAASDDLARVLAAEPLPEAVSLAAEASVGRQAGGRARDSFPKIRVFPYYWISGLAAACFAVAFVVWQARYQAPEYKQYMEIDLQQARTAKQSVPAAAEPVAPVVANGEAGAKGTVAFTPPASAPAAIEEKKPDDLLVVQLPVAPPVIEPGAKLAEMAGAPVGMVPMHMVDAGSNEPKRKGFDGTFGVVAEQSTESGEVPAAATASAPPAPLQPSAIVAGSYAGIASDADRYTSAASIAGSRMPKGEQAIGLSAFTVSGPATETAAARAYRTGASAIPPSRSKFAARVGPRGTQDLITDAPVMSFVPPEHNTEAYDRVEDNRFTAVVDHPLSTFAIDVDTASYANVRRFLQGGARPPRDAVRIEELVNYFPYDYAAPEDRDMPFAAAMEVASAPWKPEHRLVRIGLKGREIPMAQRPAANLVFLIDVSGSMRSANKLPLVKRSLRLLVEQLREDDRVALAVYAGSAGMVLPSTPAAKKHEILGAIDRLEAGGSTNGAMGIQLAYDIAKANFINGGVNRLILCTDGDFNVGVTNRGDLTRLVEEKAKSGVFLTVLGFGMGNYKDATLEQLADRGNGNHGYVDSLREAQKLLVEQAGGTLVTIAKDVKVQVDFNPAQVQAYRLIGYENRLLRKEDFNNDQIDAGEIGAGHTVTALYEVIPVGVAWEPESNVDASKYERVEQGTGSREARDRQQGARDRELLTLKLRYKAPDGLVSQLREYPLVDGGAKFEDATMDFKFAASVAAFGMILRDSPYKGSATLADVSAWGGAGIGRDAGGHRTEFLGLVKLAEPVMK